MNACVQFEVVLCLEGLLADLTFKPPSNTMSGEVAPEIPFTRENLMARKRTDQTPHRRSQNVTKKKEKPWTSQTSKVIYTFKSKDIKHGSFKGTITTLFQVV